MGRTHESGTETQETLRMQSIQDLIVGVYLWESNVRVLHFIDIFCEGKVDDKALQIAVVQLFAQPMMSKVTTYVRFWSDTHPRVLERISTAANIYFPTIELRRLVSRLVSSMWNFFLAEHAKNICDGHSGDVKVKARRRSCA